MDARDQAQPSKRDEGPARQDRVSEDVGWQIGEVCPRASDLRSEQARGSGGEGAKANAVIKRVDGAAEVIPSKMMATLRKGDRVVIETAGGAGNGTAKARGRNELELDMADGKVSRARAQDQYGLT